MNELEQFDEIIKGYIRIIRKIEDWDVQSIDKNIMNQITLLKELSETQIDLVGHFKKSIKTIGVEEIKRMFGKEKLKQNLANCTNVLKIIEDQVLFFEALVKDSSKIIH